MATTISSQLRRIVLRPFTSPFLFVRQHQQQYTSRAHPKPRPLLTLHSAMNQVLEDIDERIKIREVNWERRAEERAKKGIKEDGPYRNQDETVEFVLNLNLDPRKPGQNLRGVVALPHGTGKQVKVAVFTDDAATAKKALELGATYAGSEELVDQIVNGTVPVDSFQRTVASQDMMHYLTQKLARTLGPRGLMPNAKLGTVVKTPEALFKVLGDQLAGQAQFRTDKAGIIHIGVGKGSFGPEKLIQNIQAVINALYESKPEAYGKGKKPSKTAQYVLRGNLTATQGKGVPIDLRSIDPTSPYFLAENLDGIK